MSPTQGDTDYSWAFFNLLRQGDEQYYAKLTQDATGQWVPNDYPEMELALGQPLEVATERSTNVMRRRFERAIAYVHMSDATTSIAQPTAWRARIRTVRRSRRRRCCRASAA